MVGVSFVMKSGSIRKAGPDDAHALAKLGRAAFCETFAHLYAPDDLELFLSKAYDPMAHAAWCADSSYYIIVHEHAGTPVGFAMARPNALPVAQHEAQAFELQRLYVLRAHHGKGIGRILMEDVLVHAGSEGWQAIYLGVWENNFPAQRFYKRYGFEEVGEYVFSVGKQKDRELIFRKALA